MTYKTSEEERASRRKAEKARIAADPEAYRLRNRDKMRKRRISDPDKVRAQTRKYAENRRIVNPEGYVAMLQRRSLAVKKSRQANHAEVRQKERAKYAKAYATNPHRLLAQVHRRIALRHAAPGRGVTARQWRSVIEDSLGLCVYCAQPCTPTMDHIDPLSRGGAHDIDNLAVACDRCNKSKNNSRLLLWLAWRAA